MTSTSFAKVRKTVEGIEAAVRHVVVAVGGGLDRVASSNLELYTEPVEKWNGHAYGIKVKASYGIDERVRVVILRDGVSLREANPTAEEVEFLHSQLNKILAACRGCALASDGHQQRVEQALVELQ